MSMTTFAPDTPRTRPAASSEPLNVDNPATLMPLDDNSAPIVLDHKVMTVGRTRDNDICVPSVLVSRDHARMLVSEESVVLFDVGSINGSFVNEQIVKRHTLRDGDVVRFADRRYRYCG
jgi:pSer/pThr/pTyr-binding forkhead associated (FHA) protein